MKCRLYPNKEAKEMIDRIINGVEKAYNIATYDMITNHTNTKEFATENGGTLHYADYNKITNAKYLNWLREQHEDISFVPGGALSGKSGVFFADHQKAMSHKLIIKKTADNRIKKTHDKQARTNGKGGYKPYSIEESGIGYYNKKHRRKSYTYQISLKSAISFSDNNNVFYITLGAARGTKVKHKIKVRGWNQKLRFDESYTLNFLDYAKCLNKRITVTVSRDDCGDYYIVFKLANVYKQMNKPSDNIGGIDVGVKDIAILSDSTKFENRKYKQSEKRHIKSLNRRMSRRQGWANEKFRDNFNHNKDMIVSKKYQKTQLKLSKLHRKIARKRENYNHNITAQIINSFSFIGVETLNVKGMFRNRHLANALSDAAMGEILSMLNYKAEWYKRIIQPISQWSPSSKRCSCCGYVRPKLGLHIREWKCPECGAYHDRDINAANNILYFALLIYYGEEKGREIFEQLNNKFQLLSA